MQSLAKCLTMVQYLHWLRLFRVILVFCSIMKGCDPDATDDEDDNLVGGVLTSVGGPACRRGASQLPYISGSDFDVS